MRADVPLAMRLHLSDALADGAELAAKLGRLDQARSHFKAALAVRQAALGRARCGRLLEKMGDVQLKRGELSAAEATVGEALEALRREHGSEHLSVAKAETTLAELRLTQARWSEAEALLRSSLAKKEAVARQQRRPSSGGAGGAGGRGESGGGDVAGVGKTENLLAELAHRRRALHEARALFERVIERRSREVGPSHGTAM